MEVNFFLIFLFVVGSTSALSQNTTKTDEEPSRAKKALGIFSVIKFPNAVCQGTGGYNGTCYTSEECSAKGGSADGSCASSFGVCCTFAMSCGDSASENCTYQAMTSYSTTTDSDPCTYEICRLSADVCKLRIDFTAFTLSPPNSLATASFAATAGIININNPATIGPTLGDCDIDIFSVVSIGNVPPPVICGKNAGQHMYVDITDCVKLNFNIGTGSSTTTRTWSLKTTQIECGNRLADHECLQYHTGTAGAFMSFNFDPTTTSASTIATGSTTQHLSNQHYTICFRREEDYCGICFSPLKTGKTAGTIFGSFGVGASADGPAAKGANELVCTGAASPGVFADYIEVDGLVGAQPSTAPTSSLGLTGVIGAIDTATKTCGPFFSSDSAIAVADSTACSYKIPFKWGVHFDDGEIAVTMAAIALNTGEQAMAAIAANGPNGMIGFSMLYWQVACV